jgi:hypothetical protein
MMLPSLRTILDWASYSGSYLSTQSSPTQAERLTRSGSPRHCHATAIRKRSPYLSSRPARVMPSASSVFNFDSCGLPIVPVPPSRVAAFSHRATSGNAARKGKIIAGFARSWDDRDRLLPGGNEGELQRVHVEFGSVVPPALATNGSFQARPKRGIRQVSRPRTIAPGGCGQPVTSAKVPACRRAYWVMFGG